MRILAILNILLVFILISCQPQDVQVTITYDRNPSNVYPYTTHGEVAKIYYTVGATSYVKEVFIHRSIQITVPAKTELRATFDKYVTDAKGSRSMLEDVFYKADSKNPNWKF